MSTGPVDNDPIWHALEGLRGSAVVREAREYAAAEQIRLRRAARWRHAAVNRWSLGGALAAAAAVAVLVLQPSTDTYETQVGQMGQVALADGSVVRMNTGTAVRVRLGWFGRELDLIRGEAQFSVAHDASRPFRVKARGMSVTALGTAFDVVALPGRTAVTLMHGKVLVEAADDRREQDRRLTAPGEQVRLAGGALSRPVRVRLDAALAWQRRLVDLSGLTLFDALAEVNRYSATKIVVAEPELQHAQISGVFRAGDVDAVSAALSTYFDLQVLRRDASQVVLGRRSAAVPAATQIAS